MATSFGSWLKQQRLSKVPHLSQRRLGTLAGISNETICLLEKGRHKMPSEATVVGLAKALELDEDEVRLAAGLCPEGVVQSLRENPGQLKKIRKLLQAG